MQKKIAFHGVPRSGTTWVGSILDSSKNVAYRHQPLFSYAFKSFLSEDSSNSKINNFFREIRDTDDDFILQKEGKMRGHIPSFFKNKITHIVYKEARYHNIISNLLDKDKEIKVLGIIRNPKSVISSWYQAPKEFNKQDWDLSKEWRYAQAKNEGRIEEFYGYEKWKEVAYTFLELQKEYPIRFFLVEYSKLLKNIYNTVEEIFDFCGLDLSKQTIDFLSVCNEKDLSIDAYSVYRKNQVDDKWKNLLPSEIIRKIDFDISGTILDQFNK